MNPRPMKLILRLIFNAVLPLGLYLLIRPLAASDAALALAGAVPLLELVAVWVLRRRVNWIGLLSAVGFAVGLAISIFSGGSPLALELRSAVVAGILAAACLISVMIGRPLLPNLLRLLGRLDPARASDPLVQRRMTLITVAVGGILIVKAAADSVMALTLPTASFLAASHVVNWVILGSGLLGLLWLRQHVSGQKENIR